MSMFLYLLAGLGICWMVFLTFKFAKYTLLARFKYLFWIIVTILGSSILNLVGAVMYLSIVSVIKVMLIIGVANFLLTVYYRILARLGNVADYVLTVWGFIAYALTLFNVLSVFHSVVFRTTWHVPYTLVVAGLSLLTLAPFLAYYGYYKEKSLKFSLFVGIVLILSRPLFGVFTSYWFMILYLFLFIVYIYIEFVHPYPTLYDKYVFDYPAHRIWGLLVLITGLILTTV